MFFPFSSVSNQTYLLRKNRYQLTVFDRLNSYEELIKIKSEIKKMYIVSLKLEEEMIAYI